MIHFISTFPPIICGIGDYTRCLVFMLPEDRWSVISPKIEEFASSNRPCHHNVSYTISLSEPHLPSNLEGGLLWFQHAFGIWGSPSVPFIKLIREAKEKRNKIVVTLQSIHFQSIETPYGLDKREYELLREIICHIDALPVFTDGAYRAVARAFPEHRDKLTVLRHGVLTSPDMTSQGRAKKIFLTYLLDQVNISGIQKEELRNLHALFFSDKTVLVGNFGFITEDRDPLSIYLFREKLQKKLPKHRVIAVYIGTIQKRTDKSPAETLPLLNLLKSIHNGRDNLFFENYIPDEILPFAFRALDFTIIWYKKATQSGRMAYAQGVGSFVAGQDIEGIGETLKLSGLPSAVTMDELSEKVKRLVLEPGLKESTGKKNQDYANRFSFRSQAQKHLLITQAVCSQKKLPVLDRSV